MVTCLCLALAPCFQGLSTWRHLLVLRPFPWRDSIPHGDLPQVCAHQLTDDWVSIALSSPTQGRGGGRGPSTCWVHLWGGRKPWR